MSDERPEDADSPAASIQTAKPTGGAASRSGGQWSRIFGYDIFISFALGPAPRGTRAYASDLARRLREAGFTVFFSEDEAPPGSPLTRSLRSGLLSSRLLVVVLNRATLDDPRWVRREVKLFRRCRARRPVIPIAIDGALKDPSRADAADRWLRHRGQIWIDEDAAAADAGAPSQAVIDRLLTAPHAVRSLVRLRAAAVALIVLFAGLALWANRERLQANAAREAERSALLEQSRLRDEAVRERDTAVAARRDEEQARLQAQAARRQADEQRDIAERQRDVAEQQRRIAESQALAARAELSLQADPQASLVLAMRAAAISPTSQAASALRRAYRDAHVTAWFGTPHDQVRIARFSADGRRLAALHHPWRLEIRDLRSGTVTLRVPDVAASDTAVLGMEFVDDDRVLMVWDLGGQIRLWDANSGRLLHTLREPSRGSHELWLEPRAGLYGSTAQLAAPGVLEIWSVIGRRRVQTYRFASERVTAVGFASDGQWALAATQTQDAKASSGYAGAHTRLHLLNLREPQPALSWPAGQVLVRRLAMDPSRQLVVSAIGDLPPPAPRGGGVGQDRSTLSLRTAHADATKIWRRDAEGFREVFTSEARQDPRIALSEDGRVLALTDDDQATVLSTSPVGVYRNLAGHRQFIGQIVLDRTGERAVTGSSDGTVRIWDLAGGRLACELRGHVGGLRALSLSSDGHRLVTVGFDGTARVWKTDCGHSAERLVAGGSGGQGRGPVGLSSSALGDGWWAHIPDSSNVRWQIVDGARGGSLGVAGPAGHVVALARRRPRLVLAAADGPIQLVDLESAGVHQVGTGSDWAFGAVSDDGRVWLHGDRQGTVRVRDWSTRAERSTMRRDPSLAVAPAAQPMLPVPAGTQPPAPRGSRFVQGTLSASGELAALSSIVDVELRRTSNGTLVARLDRHREPIQKMLFSPNGARLVTLAYGLVRGSGEAPILWDTHDGAPVATLSGSQGTVGLAAFTADGRRLLTASSEAHLRLWDTVTGAMLRETRLEGNGPRGATALALSPTGDFAALARGDGLVQIVAVDTLEALWGFRSGGKDAKEITFDREGCLLAIAYADGSISRHDCAVCSPLPALTRLAEGKVRGASDAAKNPR